MSDLLETLLPGWQVIVRTADVYAAQKTVGRTGVIERKNIHALFEREL